MINNIKLSRKENGKFIIEINENISDINEFVNVINEYDIRHFGINENVTDISFLMRVRNNVEWLVFIHSNQCNYQIIEECSQLEILSVNDFLNQKLDFSKLKKLRSLSIRWNKNLNNWSELDKLNYLFIEKLALDSLENFELPKNLKHLDIVYSKLMDLGGLNQVINVEKLGIYYAKNIISLKGIEDLSQLKKITLENCKNLESIDELKGLGNLEHLELINCPKISSLESLRSIGSLKKVYTGGSTKVKYDMN